MLFIIPGLTVGACRAAPARCLCSSAAHAGPCSGVAARACLSHFEHAVCMGSPVAQRSVARRRAGWPDRAELLQRVSRELEYSLCGRTGRVSASARPVSAPKLVGIAMRCACGVGGVGRSACLFVLCPLLTLCGRCRYATGHPLGMSRQQQMWLLDM